MTYARYNDANYKYGNSSRLYGVGANDDKLHWAVLVDWDGDGVFTGENEAVFCVGATVRRGRDYFIRSDSDGKATGFEKFRIGTLRLVLENRNGRFDPYNTSSPLYPNITAGKYITVQVHYNGTTHAYFAGKITKIQPISGIDPRVIITAEDGGRILNNADVSIAIQENIDIDNAIDLVLDDINYPTLWGRSLDDSSDVLSYWWADGKAITEIQELADAELGAFFVAADGKAKFYSRHHSGASTLSLDQSELSSEIDIPQPWEVIRNVIKLIAHPLVLETGQILWTLADIPPIKAGQTLTVWAQYTFGNVPVPAINVITPVATTDYTVNTTSDGSGTNLTGSCTVTTFTDFGKTAKIILTNNSASDGYVTLLKVRGDAVTAPDASIQIAEDAASQAIYQKLLLTLDSKWIQSTTLAADFSEWLLVNLANPQKFLTAKIEGRPDKQFSLDLQDIADMTIGKLGINASYKLGSVEHEWITENGQAVRTTLSLEPYASLSGYWQFTAQIGVDTVFGI